MSELYDALISYASSHPLRLHMPGHGGDADPLRALNALASLDVTELDITGDAMTGSGPFAAVYDRADRLYGGTTVFSAGGATLALQAALLLATRARKRSQILVDRRCHKSVLNALILLDLSPVWLYPEQGVLTPQAVVSAAKKTPEAAAVILTSPTYQGLLTEPPAELPSGVRLIVDNSHGSHLLLTGRHPFLKGADYCIDSLHKTLPALTGAALLHCRESRAAALSALRLFGSTSPSFLIHCSTDLCLDYLEGSATADLARQIQLLAALRDQFAALGIPSLSGEQYDPSRLTLFLPGCAEEVYRILAAEGVVAEFADTDFLVMLPPLSWSEQDNKRLYKAIVPLLSQQRYKVKLLEAMQPPSASSDLSFQPVSSCIQSCDNCSYFSDIAYKFSDILLQSPLEQVLSPRSAYFSTHKYVSLPCAAGLICAEPLYCYPPGIPLCVPGERLSEHFCKLLSRKFDTVCVVVEG